MGYKRETVELLRSFRKNMGSDLYKEDAKRIFKATVSYLESAEENPIVVKKIQYARSVVKNLQVFNFVKFIGVSGSVGARIAKEEDDIDIFVVIKNNRLWLYRGLMLVKNLFNKRIRMGSKSHNKDQICVNLIAEERGLKFDDDIFNLHELYYLIPIYNPEYYDEVLASNQWLKRWGGVIPPFDRRKRYFNAFLEAINLYCFIAEVCFMYISGHKPETKRILKNYLIGRVEFYPSDFKRLKLSLLNDNH